MTDPTPGSPEAVAQGCTCHFCHGWGYIPCNCYPGDCICGYGDEECEYCDGTGQELPDPYEALNIGLKDPACSLHGEDRE